MCTYIVTVYKTLSNFPFIAPLRETIIVAKLHWHDRDTNANNVSSTRRHERERTGKNTQNSFAIFLTLFSLIYVTVYKRNTSTCNNRTTIMNSLTETIKQSARRG